MRPPPQPACATTHPPSLPPISRLRCIRRALFCAPVHLATAPGAMNCAPTACATAAARFIAPAMFPAPLRPVTALRRIPNRSGLDKSSPYAIVRTKAVPHQNPTARRFSFCTMLASSPVGVGARFIAPASFPPPLSAFSSMPVAHSPRPVPNAGALITAPGAMNCAPTACATAAARFIAPAHRKGCAS